MDTQIDFKNQNFLVIGLGSTGVSVIKYLKYQNANIVRVLDTRDNPPNQEYLGGLELICGKIQFSSFTDINVIIISPGISIYEEVLQRAIRCGITVIGDIELFALAIKSWDCKVIGITGTNGKTTVTALTNYLANVAGLSTYMAGNIGIPVLDGYLEIEKNKKYPELVILELSSFQLETTFSLYLEAATVLNISEDHLDRYRDLLEYAYVKANIFNNCKLQVLNSEDSLSISMARKHLKQSIFGCSNNSKFKLNSHDQMFFLNINGHDLLNCSRLQLAGKYNYLNVLASLALLESIGVNILDDKIMVFLQKFKGLEHRMQKIAEIDGIAFIEDSKGTNVGAVNAGIRGIDGYVHIILGGDGKGQDFTPIRELVVDKCKSVAVIGVDKNLILATLEGLDLPIAACNTLEEAIDFCYDKAKFGEFVVLSPACASWDMFRDYKQRAENFASYVAKLSSKRLF